MPTDCHGLADIVFGGGNRCLAAITQGVFGQLQGFPGAQQAFVDLLTQLIGLVARQGGGVLEQPFGIGHQRLKVFHQNVLSGLCLGSGHGWISVSGFLKRSSMSLARRFSANDWYNFCCVVVHRPATVRRCRACNRENLIRLMMERVRTSTLCAKAVRRTAGSGTVQSQLGA